MKNYTIAWIGIVLTLLMACSGGKQKEGSPEAGGDLQSPTPRSSNYGMPQIPDSITTPEGRADYVALHYWERFPFGEQPDSTFIEQAFVDYVAVLPVATSQARTEGVGKLFALITAHRSPSTSHLSTLMDLAAHYLGNPQSPMHSDELYLYFLNAFVDVPSVSEAEKTRPRFLIQNLQKNRVGDKATDFVYNVASHSSSGGENKGVSSPRRGGTGGGVSKKQSLYSTAAKYLLLYFNDPDCESCQQEMPIAFSMASLRHPDVRVLLVNTESEQGVGTINGQPLPENWIDGYDPKQTITSKQLYYLPAKPSLYLLDAQKNILLKDASLQEIDNYLSSHLQP